MNVARRLDRRPHIYCACGFDAEADQKHLGLESVLPNRAGSRMPPTGLEGSRRKSQRSFDRRYMAGASR